jgi:hypothetical protein
VHPAFSGKGDARQAGDRVGPPPLACVRDRRPWVPYAAARFLEPFIAGRRVFEWGAGGSTLWFADQGALSVESVEHDPAWVLAVRAAAANDARVRVTLAPARPRPAGERDPADPEAYASAVIPRASFVEYARAIAGYPARYFGIVLVDGRARCACFKQAVPHVAAGGFLVLDDSSRGRYRWCLEHAAHLGWERRDFTGLGPYTDEPWTTTVWRRP